MSGALNCIEVRRPERPTEVFIAESVAFPEEGVAVVHMADGTEVARFAKGEWLEVAVNYVW